MYLEKRSLVALFLAAGLIIGFAATSHAWTYGEAAAPYKGKTIKVLEEETPPTTAYIDMTKEFEKETGIKVEHEVFSHPVVLNKSYADLFSRAGSYDVLMIHQFQQSLILTGPHLQFIDDYLKDPKLTNPELDAKDFQQPVWDLGTKVDGRRMSFLHYNYNTVWWGRKDLLTHPEEKANFKKKYGYELAPADTWQQVKDIAEFFTRKKGEKLAGQPLKEDFYGLVIDGGRAGLAFFDWYTTFVKSWGGDIFDKEGRPTFNRPENVNATKFWASLWKFVPPGQSEYILIDNPVIMGEGVAAQTLAWSDFVFGIDREGKSKLAGQFNYRPIPKNTTTGKRFANCVPSSLVISNYSKNKEAAYLYVQWLVDKNTTAEMLRRGVGGIPVRNSDWQSDVIKKSPYKELYEAMQGSLASCAVMPRVPALGQLHDMMNIILQEIGLGKKTVEAGLNEAQKKARDIMRIR